jgi:ATP-dependent DNA ligase
MPKKIEKRAGAFDFQRPQLAKSSTEKTLKAMEGSALWKAEMKLDGHRMLLSNLCAWSRIGKDIKNMEHLMGEVPEGTLLDGEVLPKEGAEGSDVVSHLRAEDPLALGFVAFDILYHEGAYVGDQAWFKRRALLESVIQKDMEHLSLSALYSLDQYSIDDLMEIAQERGHEGIMLKKTDAPYKENSRSAWVKHKFTDTHDVVIVDCEAKPSEWRVRPGEVGKVAEVKGYGQYPTGALRHPQLLSWREDKLPEDCVFKFS